MTYCDKTGEIRYELRGYRGRADDGVIYDAWRKKIRHQPPFQSMDQPAFQHYKLGVIEALVQRLGAVLACSPKCQQQVYGWAVGETIEDRETGAKLQVLHMAYLRAPFRDKGIGKRLIQTVVPDLGATVTYHTHPTRASRHWGRIFKSVYAPHLIGLRSDHARGATHFHCDAEHGGDGRRNELASGPEL